MEGSGAFAIVHVESSEVKQRTLFRRVGSGDIPVIFKCARRRSARGFRRNALQVLTGIGMMQRQESGRSILLFVLANLKAVKVAESGARRMQLPEGKTATAVVGRNA